MDTLARDQVWMLAGVSLGPYFAVVVSSIPTSNMDETMLEVYLSRQRISTVMERLAQAFASSVKD